MTAKTTRDKVEEWIANAPDEIQIKGVGIQLLTESVSLVGKITPTIIKGGYEGSIGFVCHSWEGTE